MRLELAALSLLVVSACADPYTLVPTTTGLSPKGEEIIVTSAPTNARQPSSPYYRVPSNTPSAAAADEFAIRFLATIQDVSFRERREYCGYFRVDANGVISATRPVPGTFASCTTPAPQDGSGIFASYHTHGAYAPGYDNEVPSSADLESDFLFGMDGYVSTPGGRVWRVEYDDRNTLQICGRGCVPVDPGFRPDDEASILPVFTLAQVRAR